MHCVPRFQNLHQQHSPKTTMTMDGPPPPPASAAAEKSVIVLSIECIKGSSKADEWTRDMLQTGDIVEEIRIGNSLQIQSPFKNGRSGIQKILHKSFKSKVTSILVRVRRGRDEFAELQACIVPHESGGGRKQYMIRSIDDPNYAVGFCDRPESDCLRLQASRSSRMVTELSRGKLQDGYVAYPWERKMKEMLSVPNSSNFLSLLLLPRSSAQFASGYNDLEDTLARANAWLNASQASGIPIVFMNIQTESLLTKISGETASSKVNAGSLSDLPKLANASLYGFEDYHGIDIGVVRAVRLWYAPLGGEIAVEIKLQEGDLKLGFGISRTEEGFIYISSVIDDDENAPSMRSGLSHLYNETESASKRLVVSRVSNQKVLPWMVSSTGTVRCFDTVSLCQKLSLHRHTMVPILIHVFLWDQSLASQTARSTRIRPASPPVMPLPPELQFHPVPFELPRESSSNGAEVGLECDTDGEVSFRFNDFLLPNNLV